MIPGMWILVIVAGGGLRVDGSRHRAGGARQMTTLVDASQPSERRVRVWFGEHVIAEYTAEPAKAIRYQAAMTRRFFSLRVTIEPAIPVVNLDAVDS